MLHSITKAVKNFFYTEKDETDDINCINYRDVSICVSNENDPGNSKMSSSKTPTGEVSERIGIITKLGQDYGVIDNDLYFEFEVVQNGLKLAVKDSVIYKAIRKKENESERIISVEGSKKIDWDDECSEKCSRNEGESLERVLNGKVSNIVNKDVLIYPQNIFFSLNALKCDFTPIKGDWLSITAEVSADSESENLGEKILSINNVKPLMIRSGTGAVTFFNNYKNYHFKGVIENEIFFNNEFCQIIFKPKLGDKVSYKAIESDQGNYKWRCLSVQAVEVDEPFIIENKKDEKTQVNISISGETEFGPLVLEETKDLTLEIVNNWEDSVLLMRSLFIGPKSQSQLQVIEPTVTDNITIEPNSSLNFVFRCKAKFLGISSERFVFQFKDFKVERLFNINVVLDKEINAIMPYGGNNAHDFRKTQKVTWSNFDVSNALFGAKPSVKSKFRRKKAKNLYTYRFPERLLKVILDELEKSNYRRDSLKKLILEQAPYLNNCLNIKDYCKRFHLLIDLEEIQNLINYKMYDLRGVILRKKSKFLSLDVSCLADSKIDLNIGNQVIVTQPWSDKNQRKQVGFIHENRENELLISFHESFFKSYDESACDVSFRNSRSTFVRCHLAVDEAISRLGESWLFPQTLKESPQVLTSDINSKICSEESDDLSLSEFQCDIDDDGYAIPSNTTNKTVTSSTTNFEMNIKWFNRRLNDLQKAAVINILEGKERPLPYIIFGPPGTGKTLTVVEVILQVYHLISDSRIIIGTPSNSAADLICEHLIDSGAFTPGEMVRIISHLRSISGNISEKIVPFAASVPSDDISRVKPQNAQEIKMMESVGTQRIIIGTCSSLFSLHQAGLEQGHFSHIIIDEAGQTTEPESLIPINFLDRKRGAVILCGDPEQLGPVCLSPITQVYGLSQSLMQRFVSLPIYHRNKNEHPETGGYNPRCITRLRINYRSVPDILNLPNQMFYNSELISAVSQDEGPEAEIIKKYNSAVGKGQTKAPLIFHGIRGVNYREESGWSYFNPLEIWQTVCYLKKLYSIGLTTEDIGIITPYKKQAEKIRLLVMALKIPLPKIGSVEEFQGMERKAVILSTVRSNADSRSMAKDHIGFLSSPRRVNVAITRARAILIIIGNPFTLAIDPYWTNIIQYCIKNKFYTGCSHENLFS